MNKTRYKAKIANHTYTIIGSETKPHMDAVISLANKQLSQIHEIAPDTSAEQSAILLAINALSDQLHMQEKIDTLEKKAEQYEKDQKELAKLKDNHKKIAELETRITRYEEFEKKAKQALKRSGQDEKELSPAEVQKIINQENIEKIQQEYHPK